MAKYRIYVEALVGEKLPTQYEDGIECDGFAVIAKHTDEEQTTIAIHGMSNMDLAERMFKSTELMESAAIARGIDEAHQLKERRDKSKASKMLKALFDD